MTGRPVKQCLSRPTAKPKLPFMKAGECGNQAKSTKDERHPKPDYGCHLEQPSPCMILTKDMLTFQLLLAH
jgi:hypothetical protein